MSDALFQRAIRLEPLSSLEGLKLYTDASTSELMFVADALRQIHHPGKVVTWMIDRNVNITNICISGCTFCNFHRKINGEGTYTTTMEEYHQKIDQMIQLGGNQLLLQGGMHPRYGLKFYTDLFRELKQKYPNVKLHALGPPEVVHIARKERMTYREVLEKLMESGLDSLPGAGAEILCDRVRKEISPGKASAQEWLDVMKEAHQLHMLTSATMMFGHIETPLERMEHLVRLRELQAQKPAGSPGFKAFIPWPFMSEGTLLGKSQKFKSILPIDYIRMIALSRIMLNNFENIQASWLTVGKETGQLALHAGANDLGSIMIEENVVSAAGASFSMDAFQMQKCIADAGFIPQLRNQAYESISLPEGVDNYPVAS
ncbi:MAG: dehypoxanthine futalosine cyclase [Bacteroidetes bacterium]|nr:dehypoxanthine futalosine cyclase [Bacteroidota bacterium]